MDHLRTTFRAATHALAAIALLLCVLLPRSRYDWMAGEGLDPSGLETSGNGPVVLGVLLAIAALLEVVALATARSRRERVAAGMALAVVALGGAVRLP